LPIDSALKDTKSFKHFLQVMFETCWFLDCAERSKMLTHEPIHGMRHIPTSIFRSPLILFISLVVAEPLCST